MPQIKSQKKRVKTNNKAHKLIVSQKSALKTSIKKVLAAVDAKDKEAAQSALLAATSALDKATKKGVYHKNTSARKVSRMALAVNKMA